MRGILRVDLAHIQLVPSGLLSNRLVPSFRRRSQQPPRARPQHCPKVSTPCSNPPSLANTASPMHQGGKALTVTGFRAPWTPFLDVSAHAKIHPYMLLLSKGRPQHPSMLYCRKVAHAKFHSRMHVYTTHTMWAQISGAERPTWTLHAMRHGWQSLHGLTAYAGKHKNMKS